MDPLLFAFSESGKLGARVAEALGVGLAALEERDFEDGEHKARPLESVRGRDVFVLQSLFGDPDRSVNDKLCRLLFLLATLKDASAARVTAVLPYLCYARKDRRTKSRDPVTTRYVAQLIEAAGADRVVGLDVHNRAAFQNAFRRPADHLSARRLLADHLAGRLDRDEPVAVLSPDVGGVKRAEDFRRVLAGRLGREVGGGFMEKHRSAGVVSGEALVGDVEGRVVVLVDDLIATGGTLARAARACRDRRARAVHAFATHGLFTGGGGELAGVGMDSVTVTDSVRVPALEGGHTTPVTVSVAPLLAEAVRRIHEGGSVVELTGD